MITEVIKKIFSKIFSSQDDDSKKGSFPSKRRRQTFKKKNNFPGPKRKYKRPYEKETTDRLDGKSSEGKSAEGRGWEHKDSSTAPKRGARPNNRPGGRPDSKLDARAGSRPNKRSHSRPDIRPDTRTDEHSRARSNERPNERSNERSKVRSAGRGVGRGASGADALGAGAAKKWEAIYEDGEVASEFVAKHDSARTAEPRGDFKKRGGRRDFTERSKGRNDRKSSGEKWKNKRDSEADSSFSATPVDFVPPATSLQEDRFADQTGEQSVDRFAATAENDLKEHEGAALADKDEVVEGNADDFRKLGIVDEKLLNALNALRLIKAMPVQKSILPLAMRGCNLVCSSPTGSGKTLSFVLPILQQKSDQKVSQVVVLSPTREIAMQSKKVFVDLLGEKEAEKNVGLVIGGMDMLEQKQILRRYPSIIIATPGRLVDMTRQGFIWLNYTSIIVIDEMDRMFDLGFEDDVEQIFKELRKTDHHELPGQPKKESVEPIKSTESTQVKQSKQEGEPSSVSGELKVWMFTATLQPSIERIIDKYVPSYETVVIEQKMKISENIDHCMIFVKHGSKFDTLKKMIKHCFLEKIIVFFNTIDDTLGYTSKLQKVGFKNCVALHSKKSQKDRDIALGNFRSGKKTVLFATDIAARGIDVPEVGLVINFSIPRNPEEYVHRIGRTGRAHSLGRAITLVDDRDKKNLKKLENVVKLRFRTETLADFLKN